MNTKKKYTPRQLKKRVDEYFATTPQEQQSVTGLALALDTSRQSLCNWQRDDELGSIVDGTRMGYIYSSPMCA